MLLQSEANIIAEGRRVLTLIAGIDSALPQELKGAKLEEIMEQTEAKSAAVKSCRADLAAAIEAKDAALDELKDLLKRIKAGAKAVFGDDSLEYERMGGKRISERKKKNKKEPAAN